MTTPEPPDFDGCRRDCRLANAHTLVWGECEHAPEPAPTVSLSRVYTDAGDGYPSIGFDTYTVEQLAALIKPGIGSAELARVAAHAIVHRHDPDAQTAAGPASATDQAALRDRIRALTLLEAADFLRDAHHRDGLTVQEIGTALRNTADGADPMVGSLARDGFGLDEIAAMLDKPVLREAADGTPIRHTCRDQKAAAGPDWQCSRCSTLPVSRVASDAVLPDQSAALADDLRYMLDYGGPGHAHERPGVWDTSGKPCGHCARLAVARRNLAAYDAGPGAVPPASDGRTALSAKLWKIAEQHIAAEWICCEPLDPGHHLCAKGYAALGMAKTLLVDSDPDKAWNPQAPLLDAVLEEIRVAVLPAPVGRAAVLREAADRFDGWVRPPSSPDRFAAGVRWVTVSLRRWADETPESLADRIAAKRQEQPFVQLAEAWSSSGGLLDETPQPKGAAHSCPNCDGIDPSTCLANPDRPAAPAVAQPDEEADFAAAVASCPGYETSPNPCRCPCYGCKHHCSAHNPDEEADAL